jgi:hypothetical protein
MRFCNRFLLISSVLALAHANTNVSQKDDSSAADRHLRRKKADSGSTIIEEQQGLLQQLPNISDPCSLLQDQFTGDVSCECVLSPRSGSIGFTCTSAGPTCAGSLCGTPSYSGSIDLTSLTASSSICLVDLTPATPAGDQLCVDVKYRPAPLSGGPTVTSCTATLGDVACTTCRPCKGGVSLDCENVLEGAEDSCTPVDLVSGVSGRSNIIDPFFPDFDIGN